MFIFDEPYISDLAQDYLVESGAPLLRNAFSKKAVSKRANFLSEEEAIDQLKKDDFRWLYSNSENVIGWINTTFGTDSSLSKKIDLFKDKFTFRMATADLFPDITFLKISAAEIESLTFASVGTPFIIKPVVGFISAGVYRVNNEAEWDVVKKQLHRITADAAKAYPKEVLKSDFFIIESILPGEEYAVDVYFDDENRPVVLNILHHIFRDEHDMSDRLYITSAEIIRSLLLPVEKFLNDIASLGDFRGLPVHAEIRIGADGTIRPVEINPLRFAGWCSTDIAYYAYGINVYEYFTLKKRPDWDTLLQGKMLKQYAMAVIDRPEPLSGEQSFDYNKLGSFFSSVLSVREIDYQLFSLYAFVFFEVLPETENELEKALELDPQGLVITPQGVPG